MFSKWVAVLLLAGSTVHAAAAPIDRVEPRSWWIGMKREQLQLMVHGERVADLEPALEYPGVTLEGVERVENPNYLFVNLRISPEAKPGKVRIDFRRGDRKAASHFYDIQARAQGSAQRAGFGPADAIYLITPDRFANGDPSNDTLRGMRDGLNRASPLGRHGGDLKGVLDHLDYIAGMGFTQLWLNPVLENDQPATTYHGYAITDFYEVDARFGTNEQYRQLSRAARQRGIGLIKDVVLNHCGSAHWWMQDPPTPDWFNHEGKFVGTTHVHETVQDPYGAEEDRRAFADGWFVPTMPDLNQRNRHLATYLIQHTLWWIEYAGLSGLRIDTYPYSDRAFLADWSKRVTEEYPRLNVVGEEWNGNPITVSYWQRGRVHPDGYVSNLPSLFDFPLQETAIQVLNEKETSSTGLVRIYRSFAADGVYADPYNLVVFPDNHDTPRILTQLEGKEDLQRMALALYATTRGIPQVFYGTEVLMANPPGPKDDGLVRSDFPGGWAGDTKNAFTGAGLTHAERDSQEYLRRLLNWRLRATAVHDGKLTQYVPRDGVYVYFRQNATQKIMVLLNHADDERNVATPRFHEAIGNARQGKDVLSGKTHALDQGVRVPARTALILELT